MLADLHTYIHFYISYLLLHPPLLPSKLGRLLFSTYVCDFEAIGRYLPTQTQVYNRSHTVGRQSQPESKYSKSVKVGG